jgi:hypothetical protein
MPHLSGALCGDRHPSGPSSTRRGEVAAALGGSARLSVAHSLREMIWMTFMGVLPVIDGLPIINGDFPWLC